MDAISINEWYCCSVSVRPGNERVCIDLNGLESEGDDAMLVFAPKDARKLARALLKMAKHVEGE